MTWFSPVLLAVVCVVVAICFLLYRKLQPQFDPASFPRDKVILFQLGRGPWAPSISPFPLKLETFLRMAKIPYESLHGHYMSSKGKSPWMIYNGAAVADSQFCIDHLNKQLGLDFNSRLTQQQRATARAFQKLTEENLYWTCCAAAFGDDLKGVTDTMPYNAVVNNLMARYIQRVVWSEMWGHGIGRHDLKDIVDIGMADLRALAVQLGDKAFMFGDEPCESDCAYFGMLAQIRWHMFGTPQRKLMEDELHNLCAYCERMKERFWPDWDDNITHGGTKVPTT